MPRRALQTDVVEALARGKRLPVIEDAGRERGGDRRRKKKDDGREFVRMRSTTRFPLLGLRDIPNGFRCTDREKKRTTGTLSVFRRSWACHQNQRHLRRHRSETENRFYYQRLAAKAPTGR